MLIDIIKTAIVYIVIKYISNKRMMVRIGYSVMNVVDGFISNVLISLSPRIMLMGIIISVINVLNVRKCRVNRIIHCQPGGVMGQDCLRKQQKRTNLALSLILAFR